MPLDPMLEAIRLSSQPVDPYADPAVKAGFETASKGRRGDEANRMRGWLWDQLTNNLGMSSLNAERTTSAADQLPFWGGASGGEDAVQAFKGGHPIKGTILGGLATLGALPVVGNVAKGAGVLADVARTAGGEASDLERLVNLPAGSDPRYRGAGVDRTTQTFLRYPPKSSTKRVDKALTALRDPKNPVRVDLEATIKRGVELGGADWYNTEELRDWFVHELGETEGHAQWEEFMDLMGTNSAGSNVQQNIASASEVRRRLAQDPTYRPTLAELQTIEEARELARGRTPSYGHEKQGTHEFATAQREQGSWSGTPEPGVAPSGGSWVQNPKPKGFAQSLKGGLFNIAADLHFTRYMAMGSRDPEWLSGQMDVGKGLYERLAANPKWVPYLQTNKKGYQFFNAKKAAKDGKLTFDEAADIGDDYPDIFAAMPEKNEYKDFEDFTNEIGAEMGLTGPQVQAALWMGAADKTGVSEMSGGTFMDIIRNRVDATAKKTGKTRAEVFREFIHNKGLLSIAPLGGAAALPYLQPDDERRQGA